MNGLKRYRRPCGLFLLLLAFPLLAVRGQETSEYEKRLSKIKEEILQLQRKLNIEERKEKTILSSLDKINFKKRLIRKEMALLNVQLEKNNRDLSRIKKSIPALKATLEHEKQAIAKILVTLYKFGRFSFSQFVFQANDLKSLLTESKNLSALAKYQDTIISSYAENLAELSQAENDLKAKESEISALMQESRIKKSELDEEEKKDRALMSQIKKNKKIFEQMIREKNKQAYELQLLIEKIEKQKFDFPFPLVPFHEKKGRLPWPMEGKVIIPFGLQKHPQFKTITKNNGVEISPSSNKLSIHAVHSGKIVFADHFPGYGNLMIIDHGLSFYTLYGHCAEFLVSSGDFVKTDQPIAIAGDTGSLNGTTLYFEIRSRTTPLDPLQWLTRR
ncbi:MAG: peptidoglycan DD-metalloendopeptidase family protein [Candidatus Aminicenantales bacterium]